MPKLIGVMLAGGLATRLPNKPLLPTKQGGYPVCLSGLDYLKRHECEHVIIVTPPNSPIVDVIDHFRPAQKYVYHYQAEPKGVGAALRDVLPFGQSTAWVMVVMADNIYPEHERIMLPWEPREAKADAMREPAGECVIVRRLPAWRRPHLVSASGRRVIDTMALSQELSRSNASKYLPFSLTTPWLLDVSKDRVMCDEGWPTLSSIEQVERPHEGWWDVGTPELYAAYWRSEQCE